MMLQFLTWLAILVVTSNYVAGEKYVICYYSSWATYRQGLGKFDVAHINTELCTHAAYAFAGFDDQGTVVSLDPWLDLPDNGGRNNFGLFNALKQKNPNLKTLLSVGGAKMGTSKFSVMAANPSIRKNFVSSAIQFLQKHGFDGLDVDWEYPSRESPNGQADIANFVELLKELKESLAKNGLFLSAAVSAVGQMASLSYDIPGISRYLDLINVMTYDLNGAWDPYTGHNAPLHKGEGDENKNREDCFTVDVALEYWVKQGAPLNKIAIGLPFYGRTFTLSNPGNTRVRAPSSGAGIQGPFTAEPGYIGYNEFCTKLQTEPWTKKYDSQAMVSYAVNGPNWVSYDDAGSLAEKAQYAMKQGVAGVFIWAIETDDFHGTCGGGDYPLLRAVNKAVRRPSDHRL